MQNLPLIICYDQNRLSLFKIQSKEKLKSEEPVAALFQTTFNLKPFNAFEKYYNNQDSQTGLANNFSF